MSALTDLYLDVQSQFTSWWRNDPTAPVATGDIGSTGYFSELSTIVPVITSRAAGTIVAISQDGGQVQILPLQATFDFGRHTPPRTTQYGTQGRVLFVPGDRTAGAGTISTAPRITSANPRPVADWLERFTVFCWGHESGTYPTVTEQALAQYNATKKLFALVYAALYRAAHGRLQIGAPRWVEQSAEVFRGHECALECTIRDPIYDIEPVWVTNATATIGTYVNDQLVS